MDLDEVNVRQAINQTGCSNVTNPSEIFFINRVNVLSLELFRAGRNACRHGSLLFQVMHRIRERNRVCPSLGRPICAAAAHVIRVVIQFDAGADFYVRVLFPNTFDDIEIDAFMIPVVIRECDVPRKPILRAESTHGRKLNGIPLNPMPLRMAVIITAQHWSRGVVERWSIEIFCDHYSFTPTLQYSGLMAATAGSGFLPNLELA